MMDFSEIPCRLRPQIVMEDLNEDITVVPGPLRLGVRGEVGLVDSGVILRWLPSPALVFEGRYAVPWFDMMVDDWAVESGGEFPFGASVSLTHATMGPDASTVGGFLREGLSLGGQSFGTLRFSLVNFPGYLGQPVRDEGRNGIALTRGRLEAVAPEGVLRIDAINEVGELRKRAKRAGGCVVSHVAEWVPSSGHMSPRDASDILYMFHFWFGLLRGAWCGPVFPQGLEGCEVVWRQFDSWKVDGSCHVPTWLPETQYPELSDLFSGFVRRWHDPAWRGPLISAISWFVEANSNRSVESKIVLSQVALELLAWVHVVETLKAHSVTDFDRLSAAGKFRVLLRELGIPTALPDHLHALSDWQQRDIGDGPGAITSVRNCLTHATEKNRAKADSLDCRQLLECADLALHYVEVGLLAICGHTGHYSRRGWRSWRGEGEVRVPWVSGP